MLTKYVFLKKKMINLLLYQLALFSWQELSKDNKHSYIFCCTSATVYTSEKTVASLQPSKELPLKNSVGNQV